MAKQNALELLRREHREVQHLFQRFEKASGREQDQLCDEMVKALKMHTRIEEEVFYPYIRQATGRADLMEEASVEHGAAKQLIADLESGRDGVHRHAVVKVLSEYLGHHIREEEEKIFPLVEKTNVDLDALGQELLAHAQGGRGNVMEQGGELSRSAQRAKWIYAPEEREDHPGQTLATRNPAVIRAWAEARGGRPATTPSGDAQRPRVLRFDFPDYGKSLQPVSWEAWLKVFEERRLVFLFQQHLKSGKQSNFFRLDSAQRENG